MLDLNASDRQMALNEVKVLAKMDHPNIVAYHDSFEKGKLYSTIFYSTSSSITQRSKMASMYLQSDPKGSERFLKSGCDSQMSQATPTRFSMLFKHNYSKHF